MTLKEKLQLAWDNRSQIAEGFYHTYISSTPEIKAEAERRLNLCKENTCGFWDKTGTNPRLVIKGKGGCILCRCNGEMKTACMQCHCSLKDINEEPRWDSITTEEQEKHVGQINYDNQFKPKQ